MFGLLFGWLGAMGFWMIYFAMTLFIGTLILRQYDADAYAFVTTGKKKGDNENDVFGYVVVAACVYLFWPFILAWKIFSFVMKIVFVQIFGPLFRKSVNFAGSVMPKIEIKKD